ncbi:MAG: orotate phosphoribosyltransferase [Nitrospinota bacterium]|nr:MAG: orotate phosphoribosyltransferase [Nitrospinota bacterium]
MEQEWVQLCKLLCRYAFRVAREPIFPLASGKRSRYYIDCKGAFSIPEVKYLAGYLGFTRLREQSIAALGGLMYGAIPFAEAISLVSFLEKQPLKSFAVRKEPKTHGLQKWIEGLIEAGEEVAIVDDVMTTGTSTLQAIARAQEAGLVVKRVLVLVNREEGGEEAIQAQYHLPVESIFTLQDLLRYGQSVPVGGRNPELSREASVEEGR